MTILIIGLILLGGALIIEIPFPHVDIHKGFHYAITTIEKLPDEPQQVNAKTYVDKINGTVRESFWHRAIRESRGVYRTIGQAERYTHVLVLSLCAAVAGMCIGAILHSWMLAIVLGVGMYFIPMWTSQFALYRWERFLGDELETALSLITTSYTRSGDILAAVEENLGHINDPLKTVFTGFSNNVRYVNANVAAQIETLKRQVDNNLFQQWCDVLVLCQTNHELQAALIPIVAKFSDLKAQQLANETRMTLPLQRAIGMVALVVTFIPLLGVMNAEWYTNLTTSLFGQISMVVTAIGVLVTLNKAIRLSRPVSYDV